MTGEGWVNNFIVFYCYLCHRTEGIKTIKPEKNHHSNQLNSQGLWISAVVYIKQYHNLTKNNNNVRPTNPLQN